MKAGKELHCGSKFCRTAAEVRGHGFHPRSECAAHSGPLTLRLLLGDFLLGEFGVIGKVVSFNNLFTSGPAWKNGFLDNQGINSAALMYVCISYHLQSIFKSSLLNNTLQISSFCYIVDES